MRDNYIIVGKNKEAYLRSYTYELSIPSVFVVEGTKHFDSARVFHSLWWATRKARRLTKKSGSEYYVFHQITVDGKNYYHIVDKHLNDDILEARDKTQEKIDKIIADWKVRKGLS